ncbi:UPF0147 family protein [Candidatus Woesearchaeota archaeon]|nr:UPF0147 family protein [Candidatus Woesearchaeota archaeon]
MSYIEVIEQLELLQEDTDINKKFKEKIGGIINVLKEGKSLAVEKCLSQLEELNSKDVSSYHRTQIWDIISLLETKK